MTDNDKVLLTMTLTTLAVVVTFIPLRWVQGEYRLVITNSITMLGMLMILCFFIANRINIARYLFASFIGSMMIVIVVLNGPFQLNWCFAGMAMLYFTMRAWPALIYTQSIGLIIAMILWDQVDIQRWLQDLAALNITMMLIFYGSLTKQRYNEKLEKIASENARAATFDALTHLQNRRSFDSKISNVLSDRRTKNPSAALIYIDIDHFKSVNDNFGHGVGDDALVQTAQLLRESLRENDAFRLGGEEFVGLLPKSTKEDAVAVAERVRKHIETNFDCPLDWQIGKSTPSLAITVSIGVAMLSEGDSPESWVEKADRALYCAKQAGRNQVVMFTSTDDTRG